MSLNPFSPPRASVADWPTRVAMRKPLGVRLLQATAVLGVGEALLVLGTSSSVWPVLAVDRQLAAGDVLAVLLLACSGLAIVGAQQRKGYGRWGGLLMLAAMVWMTGRVCIGLLLAMTGAPSDVEVTGEDDTVLAVAAASIVLACAAGWAAAFSVRCRAWFGVAAPASSKSSA